MRWKVKEMKEKVWIAHEEAYELNFDDGNLIELWDFEQTIGMPLALFTNNKRWQMGSRSTFIAVISCLDLQCINNKIRN